MAQFLMIRNGCLFGYSLSLDSSLATRSIEIIKKIDATIVFLIKKNSTFAEFLYKMALGKLNSYKIDLKNLSFGVHHFEYNLGDDFFEEISGKETSKGDIYVELSVKRTLMTFELRFEMDGVLVVSCDRCLDDMDQEIDTTAFLIVKFGEDYTEESDNMITIPEADGSIDLAWFMYESIILALPLQRIHEDGECNDEMTAKLKRHLIEDVDDETDEDVSIEKNETAIDPRWNALKGLIENNNN